MIAEVLDATGGDQNILTSGPRRGYTTRSLKKMIVAALERHRAPGIHQVMLTIRLVGSMEEGVAFLTCATGLSSYSRFQEHGVTTRTLLIETTGSVASFMQTYEKLCRLSHDAIAASIQSIMVGALPITWDALKQQRLAFWHGSQETLAQAAQEQNDHPALPPEPDVSRV